MMKKFFSFFIFLAALSFLHATPSIDEKSVISLSPGEEIIVKFRKEGNKLVAPVKVEAEKEGDYCVSLSCASNFGGKKILPPTEVESLDYMMSEFKNMTFLIIKKNFKGTMTYECLVQASGSQKQEPRRNLPLKNELPCFEQYPQKLDKIYLKNFILK